MELVNVLNFNGLYKVSNNGRVFKCTDTCWYELKQSTCNKYLRVVIGRRRIPVHRIVLMSFTGENKDLCVNHKDGNKFNNNLDNLEWVTVAENNKHARDNGLCDNRDSNKKFFTIEDIAIIRNLIAEGCTNKYICDTFNLSDQSLRNIKYNRTYKDNAEISKYNKKYLPS